MTPKMRLSKPGSAAGGAGEGGGDDGSEEFAGEEVDGEMDGSGDASWARTTVTDKEKSVSSTATWARRAGLGQRFNHPPPGVPAHICMWDDGHALWLHGKY